MSPAAPHLVPDPVVPGLRACGLVAGLSESALERLARFLEPVALPAGTEVVHEGDSAGAMFFVLSGEARLARRRVELTPLKAGDVFGEIGLVTERPRAATVTATTRLELARLTRASLDALLAEEPALGAMLLRGLMARLGDELVAMTDSVGLLLTERSLPRRTHVEVRLGDAAIPVPMGTPACELLPGHVDGHPVVAALFDGKAVSLASPLVSDAHLAPLTTAHWEGREIVRHSAGLLVLEAAHRLDPQLRVRLDGTLGGVQAVEVEAPPSEWPALAAKIDAEVRALVAADVALREELWTVDEARAQFLEQGWECAAKALSAWRISRALLVSCGSVYALSPGPLLPSSGALGEVRVFATPAGLRVAHGEAMVRHLPSPAPHEEEGPPPDDSEMARAHKQWLLAMGVTCIGSFNRSCVTGQVAELIRVGEGFHEKRIGLIADRIASARPRIVCIAGPSSSGKTTFVRRLTVQLKVNGLNPVSLSLDDYYVDRERTVRDENGEYDFEAFEAIDAELLQSQLSRALAGERIAAARYDFLSGKSHPEGGPAISLGPSDVLMLEGIHGLNPRLLGDKVAPGQVFRIFIHPATALPLDRLSPVNTADLRLLRRIVRDRHGRGYQAADTILRWPSVRRGERRHIFPYLPHADAVFDSSLPYEISVLKVYADQYLLEVPPGHPAFVTAFRLRNLIDRYVTIYPDHVPPTSLLREFIGGSGFTY